MTYENEWHVKTGDTDFSGLVYTPAVIDRAMRVIEDLNTSIEFSAKRIQDASFYLPIVNVDMNYTGSINVSDVVTIQCTPTVGDSSITFHLSGQIDEDTVFQGSITSVFVDKATGTTISVPEQYEENVQQYTS
jgi:acyl-CoA thioesterase FadM